MQTKRHEFCPVCQSDRIRKLRNYYTVNGLVKCDKCSFVFMEKIPDAEELNQYYSKYSYVDEAYLSPVTVKSYNLLLNEFEQYRQNGTLLDVGFGRGWFLDAAKERGWKVYGTEFSEAAIRKALNKEYEVHMGNLNMSLFGDMKFDVITSFEVIEHLSDPAAQLCEIEKLLRPGGLFYCTTPNFNSIQRLYKKTQFSKITYPEHLGYFTKKTLTLLSENHGLKRIRFKATGISLSVSKNSKNKVKVCCNSPEHPDEIFRKKIDDKMLLRLAKRILNNFLTLTSTGFTLKGYFVKQ